MNEVDNEYAVFQQQMAAAAEADVQKKSMENFGGFTDTMPGEHDPVSPWLSKLPKNIGIGLIDAAVNASDQLGRLNNAIADKTGIPETAPDNKVDVAYNAMRQHVIDFRNGLAKNEGVADEMTHAVAQYAIPAMGFTKLIGGLQGANLLGTAGRVAAVEAATASTVVAPHDQRFADILALARETEGRMGAAMNTLAPDGSLLNSYINWMTDRTNESDFEGTVKNVIDNIGMAGLTAGLFTTGAKALKMTWKLPGYIGENLGPGPVGRGGQEGMVTFHGTDRTFPPTARNPLGEFDLGKIGTGEGVQAYGHGIYLAQAPGTARTYMPDVEQMQVHLDYMKKAVATGDGGYGPVSAQDIAYFKKQIPAVEQKIKDASLYHVDLPDEQIAKMLNWNELLSLQPDVRNAIEKAGWGDHIKPGMTGGDFIESVGSDAQYLLSADLAKAGVPGIRYLDAGSRSAGKGTSNFVIFDPKIATLIKREGK